MGIVIYILFLVALTVACFRGLFKPGMAMALVLCMWQIKQALQARIPLFANTSPLANFILAGVAGCCWLFIFAKRRRLRQRATSISVLSIVFVLMAAASILWAPDQHVYAIAGWQAVGSYVFLLILFFPDLFAGVDTLEDLWKSYLWIGGFTAAALLFSTTWFGRAVAFTDSTIAWQRDWGMYLPNMGNPLEVATLGMRLALIVFLVAGHYLGKSLSVARWVILGIAVAIMMKSGTRASVIDFGICLLIFYPMVMKAREGRSKAGFIVGVIALVIIGVCVQAYVASDTRWSSDLLAHDTEIRTREIRNSFNAWIGGGGFRFLFGYGFNGSFLPLLNIGWPEVSIASVTVDLGLVGLLLWSVILCKGFASWKRCYQLASSDERSRVFVIMLGALALSDLLLSFKGSGYLYILGWCILIARCERYLHNLQESVSVHEWNAPSPEVPLLAQPMGTSLA